jgi:hypothetical protein
MTRPKTWIYDLRDEARRHNLKLQGNGRLTKHTIEAHKRLICEAASTLSRLPLGETIIVESSSDHVFVVVRSLETRPPRFNQCCRAAQPPTVTAATVTDERQVRSSFVGTHKPSPPGWT